MTLVQTLAERKRARVEEIRAGLDALRKKLTEYGRAHGGKFMMFGSAVTGRLHYQRCRYSRRFRRGRRRRRARLRRDDLRCAQTACRRSAKSMVQGRIHRQDRTRVVGDIVSDARWFEVDLDIRAAVDHFEKSIVLHRSLDHWIMAK